MNLSNYISISQSKIIFAHSCPNHVSRRIGRKINHNKTNPLNFNNITNIIISSLQNLSDTSLPDSILSEVVIKYRDDDNELITIANEKDLSEACSLMTQNNNNTLLLEIETDVCINPSRVKRQPRPIHSTSSPNSSSSFISISSPITNNPSSPSNIPWTPVYSPSPPAARDNINDDSLHHLQKYSNQLHQLASESKDIMDSLFLPSSPHSLKLIENNYKDVISILSSILTDHIPSSDNSSLPYTSSCTTVDLSMSNPLTTSILPASSSEYQVLLEQLNEQGYHNATFNTVLLDIHKGNMEMVIKDLIKFNEVNISNNK